MSSSLSDYISLSVAMRSLSPPRHVATGYRWAQRGCRGVRLRTYLVGGARATTLSDLETFIDEVTAAGTRPIVADAVIGETAVPPRETKAARHAQRELDRRGV